VTAQPAVAIAGQAPSPERAASTPRFEAGKQARWIESPAYDLALFVLSPLAGLFVLWANFRLPGGAYIVLAATYLVAIPHYLSSFTFFLGDENLAHYRARWTAFFLGPVLILMVVVLMRILGYHRPVQSAMFVWNVYHVSLQSAGILSIYRRLNGGPQSDRPVAHLAILSLNATMAFWFLDRFPPLYSILAAIHPLVPFLLPMATLAVALPVLGVLISRLVRRKQGVALPEGLFLLSSLLLFHPYLWVADSNLATFGMLMGHFIQYLGIVWLLNRRKYAGSHGSTRERTLGWISARPALVLGTIALSGSTFYLFNKVTALAGISVIYVVAWNALTLIHFYLDGLIWAFKRPFVRQTIGPYLTPTATAATS
jgi:hypothetical protein